MPVNHSYSIQIITVAKVKPIFDNPLILPQFFICQPSVGFA